MSSKLTRSASWLNGLFCLSLTMVLLAGCGGNTPTTSDVDPAVYGDKKFQSQAKNNSAVKKGRIPMPPK